MNSYFTIELDTTPPEAVIHTLDAVSDNDIVSIVIDANELFDDFQEVYIIDSRGRRYDLSLVRETDRFVGTIVYEEMYNGIATIHATVRDLVYNQATFTKTVDIKEIDHLTPSTREYVLKVSAQDFCLPIGLSALPFKIKTKEELLNANANEYTLKVDVTDRKYEEGE